MVIHPLHMDDYYLKGNILAVNFFRLQTDSMGGDERVEFKQWVEPALNAE